MGELIRGIETPRISDTNTPASAEHRERSSAPVPAQAKATRQHGVLITLLASFRHTESELAAAQPQGIPGRLRNDQAGLHPPRSAARPALSRRAAWEVEGKGFPSARRLPLASAPTIAPP